MRVRPTIITGLALAAILGGARVAAHDFWIEPGQFQAAPGSVLSFALRVGEHFKGDPVRRSAAMVDRFIIAGPDGVRDVAGREGADPAGTATLPTPGLYIVAYRSRPSSVELDAAKFETYLREEGLERIIEQRKQTGRSLAPGLEIFSRCAKALVVTQPAGSAGSAGLAGSAGSTGSTKLTGHDRVLGLRLELIPETNPYAPRPRPSSRANRSSRPRAGATHTFRLLYEGQPLEGALVVAVPRDGMPAAAKPLAQKPSARSDKTGRVTLALPSGVWMVKAVHMVPAPKGVAAEWESLWASLTFEIGG